MNDIEADVLRNWCAFNVNKVLGFGFLSLSTLCIVTMENFFVILCFFSLAIATNEFKRACNGV
jgi:hypothetical protein